MAESVFGTMLETAQGLQGLGVQQRKLEAFDAEQAALQQERDYARQRRGEFNTDLKAALENKEQMPQLMLKYPEYADKIGKGVEMLDTQTKSRLLNSNASIVQMIDAGNMEGAKQTVQQNIDLYRTMPPAVLSNPKLFRGAVLTQLAADPNGREMIKQLGAAPITPEQQLGERRLSFEMGKEQFDQKIKQADLKLRERGVEVQEQQLINSLQKAQNPELSAGLQKLVDDTVTNSIAAQSTAGQMRDLATRAKQLGWTGGTRTEFHEWLKSQAGWEDEQSRVIKSIEGVLGKEMLSMLPPGPATDRDVSLARKAVMKATANPQELAQALDAAARLQDKAAAVQQAKSEYISQNGGLGKAKRDVQLEDGLVIPSGTSYSEAMKIAAKNAAVIWEAHPRFGRVTELDIEATMKANRLSRQQAIDYLKRAQ